MSSLQPSLAHSALWTVIALWTLHWLKAGREGGGGAVQYWLTWWHWIVCILILCLDTGIRTVKSTAAMHSGLIKEFENRLQDWKKNHQFMFVALDINTWYKFTWYKYTFHFSLDINTLPPNFQTEWIELQSDNSIQKSDHISLPGFHKSSFTREKYPLVHNRALFMPSFFLSVCTFVNNY